MAVLLTSAMMRAVETAWFAAGNDSFALMQQAAAAVADQAARMVAPGGRITVLAGPGNNGGDGFVAASLLKARGFAVSVVAPLGVGRGDAARAAEHWHAPFLTQLEPVPGGQWAGSDLVIDALFGIGANRPLSGVVASLVAQVNGRAPILAVDMPSGVDADSGAVSGTAVRADATVSFHTAKPGHYLYPGRRLSGELVIADIGLPPAVSPLQLNGPDHWQLPYPDAQTHKYARGGAVVWSGPALMTGAARLAAAAALRVGAGAVVLAGERDALLVQAAHVTAVMLHECAAARLDTLLVQPKWRAAVVGPGAGSNARAAATAALAAGKAVVLDADALSAFAGDLGHLARLIGRHKRPAVLTPHEGEFSRLFPDMAGCKLDRALEAARQSGATIILKGPDTVIASPDGRAAIQPFAPAWLATAGAGDVLAGLVTGLLAQGMDAFAAACAAVFVHAEAGKHLGAGLIAEDLAGSVLREVLAALTPTA